MLRGAEQQDIAVLKAARTALEQLVTLARAERALAPAPDELAALLHDLDVFVGTRPGPGLVTVAEPLALRARRVRILFACGLQEGVFPAAPRTEPFFGDVEREQIAEASGLRLRRRDDLGAERYLFYAAVSRPEERLYLSWHEAGDDGDLRVRSFFVSDVCDLFGPELEAGKRTRSLGEVGFVARQNASATAWLPMDNGTPAWPPITLTTGSRAQAQAAWRRGGPGCGSVIRRPGRRPAAARRTARSGTCRPPRRRASPGRW